MHRPPPPTGLEGGRRLGPPPRRPPAAAPRRGQARPRHGGRRRRHRPRLQGGSEATGPSPVDRGANACDQTQILPVIVDLLKVGGKPGRPKEHPDELYADRRYDSDATRTILRWIRIEPMIATRNTPHCSGCGKVRRVVERTISWIDGLRRMRVQYGRLGVASDTWTTLAVSVVCFHILTCEIL